MEELTPKQAMFCKEYIVDLNGRQAAIRAGYSEKGAQTQSSVLLSIPKVKAEIDKLISSRAAKVEITADIVLSEILRLARVDLSGAYDDEGKLLPVKQMPEDVRRAIASVETFEEYEGSGNNRKYIGDTMKVKFWDKTKALELLGKHLKLFTEKIEHSGRITLEDLLDESMKPQS